MTVLISGGAQVRALPTNLPWSNNGITTYNGPSGGSVSLQYRLANTANIGFHLAVHNKKAPRVDIRQANAVVGQGQFEFG